MLLFAGSFVFFAVYFSLSMCTLCASSPPGSRKHRFYTVVLRLLPGPVRARFERYLMRYAGGRSYAFAVFIVAIVLGCYQVTRRFMRGPLHITLPGLFGPRTTVLDYDYVGRLPRAVRVHFYSLYVRQVLSFMLVFAAPPDVRRARASDHVLGIPERRHRCRACGSAVAKFDHHCIWISGCVAAGNQPLFTLFLLETAVDTGSHALHCVDFLWRAWRLAGAPKGAAGFLLTNFTPVVAQAAALALISVSITPFAL